jgi:NADP-dependent 3-hydroxy acid dehydrogenase YdfG
VVSAPRAQALAAEGAAVLACARRFTGEAATTPALGQVAQAHLDVTDEVR